MTPEQFVLYSEIEDHHWWFVARREILRTVIRCIQPPNRQATVIDVGCGTGGNIASLAGEYRCIGVDTTEDAIRLARSRFPNVTFVLGEFPNAVAGELPSVSVLMCTDVIEHVEDDRGFVRRLVSAIRPNAHLLLTVPADMSLWSQHDVTNDHFRRYDKASFEGVWAGLPVESRVVTYFNSRLYPLVKAARAYSRWRDGSYGKAGTDFRIPPAPLNRLVRGVFAGERRRIARSIDREGAPGYQRGVSLLALLRRLGD